MHGFVGWPNPIDIGLSNIGGMVVVDPGVGSLVSKAFLAVCSMNANGTSEESKYDSCWHYWILKRASAKGGVYHVRPHTLGGRNVRISSTSSEIPHWLMID